MSLPATLRAGSRVAEATWELDFDLGGRRVDFAAGQYCRIQLPDLPDAGDKPSRKFSIVNAPQDNGHLVVLTREGRTGYKRALCALRPGAPAVVRSIKGKLVLPTRLGRSLVFIAGGVGIAPFISMLRDLRHRGRLALATLLYFNRSPASAAYLPELKAMAAEPSGLHLMLSMTRHPGWTGETARLSPALLRAAVPEVAAAEHYVVGAPAMVAAAVRTLHDARVPAERVHDEDFSGYQ